MGFLTDNLIASLVSGTVILILFTIQMRATNTSVSESARNQALSQAETFATWLEEDLEAAGRNRDDSEPVFSYDGWYDNSQSPTDSTLEGLTFYYRDVEGGATTTINYEIEDRTRTVAGTTRTVYRLTRQENGSEDGQSPSSLGYFDLRFVGKNGRPTTTRDSIRGIRVQYSVLTPFRTEQSTLTEAHRMVVVPYAPAQG